MSFFLVFIYGQGKLSENEDNPNYFSINLTILFNFLLNNIFRFGGSNIQIAQLKVKETAFKEDKNCLVDLYRDCIVGKT